MQALTPDSTGRRLLHADARRGVTTAVLLRREAARLHQDAATSHERAAELHDHTADLYRRLAGRAHGSGDDDRTDDLRAFAARQHERAEEAGPSSEPLEATR
jgi:hypothetical protein